MNNDRQSSTSGLLRGTVKFFHTEKGYGFITPDAGGKETFVHITSIEKAGISPLQAGEKVYYSIITDKLGKELATNLARIEAEAKLSE